jgi:hypothetical protein
MATPEAAPASGPIAWIIGVCARHPGLTLLLVAASAALGVYSVRQVPLDAILAGIVDCNKAQGLLQCKF